MNICVFGAASNDIDSSYLEAGFSLGERIAKHNHTLIFGGGATGLMGAVARGVSKHSGNLIGVAPHFFNTDGILYTNCSEFIFTDTMRQRKKIMEEKSDAFIVTPGGIGTLEEFLEILTLRSLERHNKPIAILNTNGYFDKLIDFLQNGVNEQFLRKIDLELFYVDSDVEKIINHLQNYKA